MSRKAVKASEFPTDTSYMKPWCLDMIYEIEPGLKRVVNRAAAHKRRGFYKRLDAYAEAKAATDRLLGWGARDPRLRSSGAWDCFFDHVLEVLRL